MTDDLVDAADRAHGISTNSLIRLQAAMLRQCEGRLREARDQLSAAHDEIRRLHDAGMDASGDGGANILKYIHDALDSVGAPKGEWWADGSHYTHYGSGARIKKLAEQRDRYRQRAIDQEREAARLRELRHMALEDNLRLLGELGRARRWSAAWKRAAKAHRAGRHMAANLFVNHLRMLCETEGQLREAEAELKKTRGAGMAATQDAMEWRERHDNVQADKMLLGTKLKDARRWSAAWKQLAKHYRNVAVNFWQAEAAAHARKRREAEDRAVQGYRLMREIDELLGDAPFTSWDDLRYVVRRYREGSL